MKMFYSKKEDLAWQLIKKEVRSLKPLEYKRKKVSYGTRKSLQEAMGLFEDEVLRKQNNWPAMWALGKIHLCLGNDLGAMEWFGCAHKINPRNADIAKEAGLSALRNGLTETAIRFIKPVTVLFPKDAELLEYLALAYILDRNIQNALKQISTAITIAPKSVTSIAIRKLALEIQSGKTSCPKTFKEMVAHVPEK